MSCPHVAHLLDVNSLCALSNAAQAVFANVQRPLLKADDACLPKCMHKHCKLNMLDVHVCVQCVHFSCKKHLPLHANAKHHFLFINVEHARLYCTKCADFVFNPYVDGVIELQRRLAVSARRNFFHSAPPQAPITTSPRPPLRNEEPSISNNPTPKKRRLSAPTHWVPTKAEFEIFKLNALRIPQRAVADAATPVGLYNLGNSCYMNSVLHAICHAPPLRYHFLADSHRPFCQKKNQWECLGCALDGLIAASFRVGASGAGNGSSKRDSNSGFAVPQSILEIIWKNADHLASYAQHDAHEFLIAALNVLHNHCKFATNTSRKSPLSSNDEFKTPPSVVKSLFSGMLQSDVVCKACGHNSPTLEEFFDVSLDVDKVVAEKARRDHSSDSTYVNSIFECLARFTEPESLGSNFPCSSCGKKEVSSKQMSIRSMPAIVSFHFKRFEKSFVKIRRSEMVKVDTPVEFPVDGLDLSPFQTSNVLRRRWLASNGRPAKKCEAVQCEELRPRRDALYDLFAVVNHSGTIDSGHYTTMVRRDGDWYRCDDDKINKIKNGTIGKIMRSKEAYLCFYAQREPNLTF